MNLITTPDSGAILWGTVDTDNFIKSTAKRKKRTYCPVCHFKQFVRSAEKYLGDTSIGLLA